MVQVQHTKAQSKRIITSAGTFDLDAQGMFQTTQEQADHLCDESKYAGIFRRVGGNGTVPAPKAAKDPVVAPVEVPVDEPEADEEEETRPTLPRLKQKKKVRRN